MKYCEVQSVLFCVWNRRYSNWKKGGWWRGDGKLSTLQKYSYTEIQKIRNTKIHRYDTNAKENTIQIQQKKHKKNEYRSTKKGGWM